MVVQLSLDRCGIVLVGRSRGGTAPGPQPQKGPTRQTGTALEGCETVNAAKTVSGQYTPVPLTRMTNWKQGGSVSSSLDSRLVFFFLLFF